MTDVNDAPVLSDGLTLATMAEDPESPAGATISVLCSGLFSDPDNPIETVSGFAIVGNAASASAEGAWQYSTDGTTWHAVGAVGFLVVALRSGHPFQ